MDKIKQLIAERKEIISREEKIIEDTGLLYQETLETAEIESDYLDNQRAILKEITDKFNELPVDFILETLTHLGWAPCVIYDDNGNWAIDDEGCSSVRTKDTEDYQYSGFIEAKQFKQTIREALKEYIEND